MVAERIELTPEAELEPLVRQGERLVLKPSGKAGKKHNDAAAQVRAEREAQARRDVRR